MSIAVSYTHLRTDGLSGLESGFTKLDKMTSGWQNSDLIIIAARPAMGKTCLLYTSAYTDATTGATPLALMKQAIHAADKSCLLYTSRCV